MSRRKQGRPQQRKTLDSLEQENDLLVCGDCQTSFPLHDIVQFIRHKKQCCNKENIDATDGANRKPGGGNNTEINGHRIDDDADDNDEEGVDLSRSSSRREVADEVSDDIHDDKDDDDSLGTPGCTSLVNGEGEDRPVKQENVTRKSHKENSSSTSSSSCRELRTPLRQKQVVDAESNTTHSEPSRFVCETCRSTYTSAWALLQHAQKEHGMKIYTSPSASSSQNHHSPSASTPTPNTISPMELVIGSPPRSGMDHRSVSAGSGGSASPYPVHTPNPFSSPFRLPLDTRLGHPTSLSPFSRSPNFDFDVINDCRLRPQLLARGASGLEHPLFSHSPFDRARPHLSPALESHYDYYSMRLKQLASSPVVSQARSQFSASSQPHPPNIAVPPTSFKAESPPAETSSASSRGNGLTSALLLPPKHKACEFCGKNFRFQSNLVVHRRSHTGEKPYKCSHCPHACTQQSKLKRHMKTHSLKADGSSSPCGTPNHKDGDDCNDDDDDEEDEDDDMDDEDEDEDEECEEEEDIIEEEMNDEEREVLERMKATKNNDDFIPEPGEIRHSAKRIKLEHNTDEKGDENNLPSDLSMKSKPSESLLSEVMKRTGLNDIQPYSEAYKAALAESQEGGKETNEDKKYTKNATRDRPDSPRSPRSPRIRDQRELESEKDSDKEDHKEHLFLGGTDLLSKSLKRDSSTPSVWSPSVESLPTNSIDPATASLYSRLHHSWFAENPTRLFFTGYPPRFAHSRDLSLTSESHNGLNLSPSVATTSSALKADSPSIPALFKPSMTSPSNYPSALHRSTSSSSSSPTGSLLLPNNNSSILTSQRKESRRNDTCEYCGKVFKNCSNLTVHRRSHTGEKPYKCNLCSYACAQSSKLTRHMKTHGRQGKDVYTCKFCNMPFSVPSTLEKHMRKCVENRNARLLGTDEGDISSESNGEMSRQSDSASGAY